MISNTKTVTAEFRGPGVKNHFEESGDDYDMDLDSRTRGMGGRSGRIILLGDGSEILTDGDDTEMFDHGEEDKDLESQVSKSHPELEDGEARPRSEREETPAPQPQESNDNQHPTDTDKASISGTATLPDTAKVEAKRIPESAIPEKLVSPAKT